MIRKNRNQTNRGENKMGIGSIIAAKWAAIFPGTPPELMSLQAAAAGAVGDATEGFVQEQVAMLQAQMAALQSSVDSKIADLESRINNNNQSHSDTGTSGGVHIDTLHQDVWHTDAIHQDSHSDFADHGDSGESFHGDSFDGESHVDTTTPHNDFNNIEQLHLDHADIIEQHTDSNNPAAFSRTISLTNEGRTSKAI